MFHIGFILVQLRRGLHFCRLEIGFLDTQVYMISASHISAPLPDASLPLAIPTFFFVSSESTTLRLLSRSTQSEVDDETRQPKKLILSPLPRLLDGRGRRATLRGARAQAASTSGCSRRRHRGGGFGLQVRARRSAR